MQHAAFRLATPARLALVATFALGASLPFPASVPAETAEDGETTDGRSLIEEGARLFLRGLMAEMEPGLSEMLDALDEMRPLIEDWGPRMHEIIRMMGDIRNYDPPVLLPNGDILIRRRTTPESVPPSTPEPGAEIEL